MGIFEKLRNPGEIVQDALGIIDQAVVDKDAKLKLQFAVMELDHHMRLAELNVKTVPWVDALHKMGRQIISLTMIIGVVVLLGMGVNVDLQVLAALGISAGPGAIYTAVKGKGK